MKTIYSDIWAEVLTTELGDKRIQIYNGTTTSNPSLVLPTLLAMKKLNDYFNEIIKDNKDYFERVGE